PHGSTEDVGMTNRLPSTQTAATASHLPARRLNSSLEQRSASARLTLAQRITPNQAAKAADQLVGQFASLRADNPKVFIQAVSDVFEQYPPGVVEECIDPRTGLASRVEFLSLKSLGDWCRERRV